MSTSLILKLAVPDVPSYHAHATPAASAPPQMLTSSTNSITLWPSFTPAWRVVKPSSHSAGQVGSPDFSDHSSFHVWIASSTASRPTVPPVANGWFSGAGALSALYSKESGSARNRT